MSIRVFGGGTQMAVFFKTPQEIPQGAKAENTALSCLECSKFTKAKLRENYSLFLLKGRKRESTER